MKSRLLSLRCHPHLLALGTLFLAVAVQGQPHSHHHNHDTKPNVDRRHHPDRSALPPTASPSAAAAHARNQAATALREKVKNVRIDLDEVLGTPAFVGSTHSHLSGPGGRGLAVSEQALARHGAADPHRAIKAFIDDYGPLFGHRSDVVAAARVLRDYNTAHNGMRTVMWEQYLDGIRVFEATFKAHLTARGELVNVGSRLVPNLESAAQRGAPGRAGRIAQPTISAKAAVALAATDIGEDSAEDDVESETTPQGPELKQRLRAPRLLEAEAQYVWLPLTADTVRLCWEVICTSRSDSHMYRLLVDAESGEIHVRHSLTEEISDASYRVFTSDSPSPFSPGHSTPSSVQPPTVSRTLVTLSALNPTASPDGWISDGVMETRGNNVAAHTDINADNQPDLPRPQATGPGRVFDPPLDLTQSPSTYRDAAVVNLFYWCNWMHDRLYELGFTEAAGNFQLNNFGRGGLGNDAIQADAQDGSGTNNANFSTPPDGSPGRMQMYVFTGPTPDRDGDFDAEIILHEYTHGLSNRLVGGGVGISALQSRGMGEGWSDFYALALLSESGDALNGAYATGGYATYQLGNLTENYYFGIRRYPYSTDLSKNPLTFKDIDPTQASAHAGIPRSPINSNVANQVHNMGEVWCVTLWDARANLINKHGFAIGNQLILQLVTDGMKLAPANPTYLQARDAIFQADMINTGGANRMELWAAFAKRGMGASASAPASSTSTGVVESFELPDDLSVAPFGAMVVSGDVGGPFPSVAYTLTNTGSAAMAWTATKTQPWITLSTTSGTLAAGAVITVNVVFNANAGGLPFGTYSDTLTFTNATSGVAQTRALTLVAQQPPTISAFSPTTIAASMPVTITGDAFVAPVTVRFNGVLAASVTINSPTEIIAVAPATLSPGPITVTTAAGTATSATNYAVTLAPIITGFTPSSGPHKRMVTLTGYNFSGSFVSSRTVRVNGVSVSSITVGPTRMNFPVPVGATTGPITVTTTGPSGTLGTATSATHFIVADGPAPANDHFANAQAIAGSTGTVDINTTNATLEPGEPRHGMTLSGSSVWYSWVAPTSGQYLFHVQDVGLNMGTVQGIYIGNAVNALALVGSGSSNSAFSGYTSSVVFNANAGTTYKIAVGGFDGLMGECKLSWSPLAAPSITSFSGFAYAGQPISISGNNFTPGASVAIGNVTVPASSLLYFSPNSITIRQVPSAAVSAPLSVTTPAGTFSSTGAVTITTPPPPNITSVAPTTGQVGSFVSIIGSALSLAEPGFPIVRFNGVPAATITSQSSTSLAVRVPTGATSGPVTVETSRGTATSTTVFTVTTPTPPTPFLFSFAPARGPIGSVITISGANLSGATAVQLNGVPVPFTINSPNQITATVPSGATAGLVRVIASTLSSISTTAFIVTTPPVISGFSPSEIAAHMQVVISGSSFNAVTAVTFNGSPAASFVVDSNSQITARVPAVPLTPGPISVSTQEGTATSAAHFTLAASGPAIAGFSPTAIASGVSVVITGIGFADVTSVRFNGVSAQFTVNSPTQITATAPANVTPGAITVTTPLGVATSPSDYTVTLAPIITSFTPASATHKQLITVFGGNFLNATTGTLTVRVNGVPITSSSRNNNRITFPIPVGATTGPITITTQQGTATSATNIIIAPGPAPANDHFADASVISGVNGSTFGNTANATKEPGEPNHSGNPGGASVWFKWTAPTSGWFLFNPFDPSIPHYGIIQAIYTGTSVDQLTLVASGLPGTSVFTRYTSAAALNAVAGQTYMIALDGFSGVMADYRLTWSPLAAPTFASFSPPSAAAGQITSVFITGSGFTPGATVRIGGALVAANRVMYNSPTSITVTQVPLGAVTGPIVVTTPVGTVSSSTNFVITSPYILGFSPSGAAVGSPVTITGANLAGATAVQFNGVAATSFAVDAAGQTVTTSVPAGATTGPISVVTPNGTAVSNNAFVVVVPPVITQQPEPQTVFVGDTVTFGVAATSNGPVEFHWRRDGVGLINNPTASTPTLVISSASLADAGVYDCQVGNNAGVVTSNAVRLTVNKVPATVVLGGLSAVYDGTPKPASASTSPSGLAVDLTYSGSPVAPTNAGSYAVVATINDARYTGSASGTLTIARAPATITVSGLAVTYDGTPKPVGVATNPAGLPVAVTYAGSSNPPTNAGSYAIAATVTDPNYLGSATGTLTIEKATATVTLAHLTQSYDGTPKTVSAAATPAGLSVNVLYDGSSTAPTNPGSYAVTATVSDANYAGTSTGTLAIVTTALVRHAPVLSGGIDGSLQIVSPDSVALNGNAWISRDLLMPGTPGLQVLGTSTVVGTRDGGGSASPSSHEVSLNGNVVLRYLVRRIDGLALPSVAAPPAPTGTRSVIVTTPGEDVGDFLTVRNLTARGNAGAVAVPPGTYGQLRADGNAGFVLGVPGATQPAIYNLESLTLNANRSLEIVGPVILTLGGGLTIDGVAGSAANPAWLTLRLASGGLTLNGNAAFHGVVIAPNGPLTLSSNATVNGRVMADTLRLHANAAIHEVKP